VCSSAALRGRIHFSGAARCAETAAPSTLRKSVGKIVVQYIYEHAAGADGIVGTADDLIPAKTMATLKMMLESDLVDETINLVASVAKGEFKLGDLTKLGQTAMAAVTAAGGPAKVFSSCLPCLGGGAAAPATVAVTTTPGK